ncbi:DNA methyltransferase [Dehalococcoides mccartyi]|uniref:DNA methyltransferase n=1 Tax=Dehalococcoides mccartyi TaxID=61435 RepID=UPI0009D69598|nr:DNA methyltransferase [Dehalococcoides mccartyi]
MDEHRIESDSIKTDKYTNSNLGQEQQGVKLIWSGKRSDVERIVLPFQRIEVVNESRATREAEKGTFLRSLRTDVSPDSPDWRNKLIWGDNKYVIGSLLEQFAGKVDLIYIDPPFGTGQNFSFSVEVGDEELTKTRSIIEEKAYRDTWGRGTDSYLSMMYERLHLLRQLLSEKGSIFVHLDVHMGPYIKVLMDEVFGQENFQNEIAWYYYNKLHGSRKRCIPKAFDQILYYVKNREAGYTFHTLSEPRENAVKKLKYSFINGKIVNDKDEQGKVITYVSTERQVDNVWRIRCLQPANLQEWVNYDTQKPVDLIERVLQVSSEPGDLVLDAFVGSGSTAVAAERQKRRWIAIDLSRFSIHTTRKRLLNEDGCSPFEVLNLGKYERQYWQGVSFGSGSRDEPTALHQYFKFILDLYKAEPTSGLVHLHGQRAGRMVHIGAADSPVTLAEIRDAVDECRKIKQEKLDILGWEWEMGLHDVIEAESKRSGMHLRLLQIPSEAMDKRAVDAGDVHFFELAYLQVEAETKDKEVRIKLKNFVMPSQDLIPDEIHGKIRKWSDYIDYWAVDFEFNDDTFHNLWQDYRTRSKRDLSLTSDWHDYKKTGRFKVLVKVFDIFGNDTTHLLEVRV